jgi:hypothetical protein
MRQYQLLDHLLEFKTVESESEAGLSGAELAAKTRGGVAPPAGGDGATAGSRNPVDRLSGGAAAHRRCRRLELRIHTVVSIGLERLVW